MSDIIAPAARTPSAPIPASGPHWWNSLELAAASVYHGVLSFETNVSAWVAAAESNPSVKALIGDAVALFESMVGVSPAAVNSVTAILAMLGKMAAADSTTPSGSSPSTVVQPAIPAPPPAAIVLPAPMA
jgi:hypothetical protein